MDTFESVRQLTSSLLSCCVCWSGLLIDVFNMNARCVLLPVGHAHLGREGHDDSRLGSVDSGLERSLAGGELAVLELGSVLAGVPDGAVLVLGVAAPGVAMALSGSDTGLAQYLSMVEFGEAGGLKIAYGRVGEGPPLVFVHGAAEDSRIWQPQLD